MNTNKMAVVGGTIAGAIVGAGVSALIAMNREKAIPAEPIDFDRVFGNLGQVGAPAAKKDDEQVSPQTHKMAEDISRVTVNGLEPDPGVPDVPDPADVRFLTGFAPDPENSQAPDEDESKHESVVEPGTVDCDDDGGAPSEGVFVPKPVESDGE